MKGHPEEGEESFVVRRDGTSALFDICAMSRAATVATRVGSPLARRIQRGVTSRYLEGIRTFASSPE